MVNICPLDILIAFVFHRFPEVLVITLGVSSVSDPLLFESYTKLYTVPALRFGISKLGFATSNSRVTVPTSHTSCAFQTRVRVSNPDGDHVELQ